MLPFANKPLDEWTAADLQTLKDQQVTERHDIEFKREPYGAKDEDKREMLRDVSALANAYGGFLFLGIEEDDQGAASEIVGIEDADGHRERVLASCLTGIERTIAGLRSRSIPLSNDRSVLVIAIPGSHLGPHMVTYQGLNQFWIRRDRAKGKMTVEEIADAFLRTRSLLDDLKGFLNTRRHDIPTEIGNQPFYILGATPLGGQKEIIDIFDEQLRKIVLTPRDMRPHGWNFAGDNYGECRPSLYGLRRSLGNDIALEMFRTGHIEARISIKSRVLLHPENERQQALNLMNAYPLVEYLVSFCRVVRQIRGYTGLRDPFVLSVWLHNIRGCSLSPHKPGTMFWTDDIRTWNGQHLELPPVQVADLVGDGVARERADRLWQAFGFDRAPLFNEDEFNPG